MIEAAFRYVEARAGGWPKIAVVLGSGLGAFAEELTDAVSIPYSDIPGWPRSTAVGHAGELVFGRLGSIDVAVMSGRTHLYEGYSPEQVTLGVRVLGRLGVKTLVFTNAAGGINRSYSQGGLVLISD
ncbi:MAG: purine-nucleoside phosphorylase, partial [Bryobacteraceae bacterium]